MLSDIQLKVLRLLDENRNTSGSKDYMDKMNSFIDTSQKQIAQIVPIRKTMPIVVDGKLYPKPAEVREITEIRSQDLSTIYPIKRYGDSYLFDEAGQYIIEYAAYPATISDDTPITAELDIAPELQEAIPYFAAAMCVADENPQLYVQHLSTYNEMIANMQTNKPAYIRIVSSQTSGGDFDV